MKTTAPWEFWIDVGGTFTDCLARRPDGVIVTHKLLSSGIYKGRVDAGSSRTIVRSRDRIADPPGFFAGYRLSLYGSEAADSSSGPVLLDSDVAIESFDPATGELTLARPLAVNPEVGHSYEVASGEEAPLVGIRWLLGIGLGDDPGPIIVRLGTTRGTNALLERQGAPTALVTTRGFGDALRIAYQNRPKLFELNIRKSGGPVPRRRRNRRANRPRRPSPSAARSGRRAKESGASARPRNHIAGGLSAQRLPQRRQ